MKAEQFYVGVIMVYFSPPSETGRSMHYTLCETYRWVKKIENL